MKITENMIQESKARHTVEYAISKHHYNSLTKSLMVESADEWLLHVGNDKARTWKLEGNPTIEHTTKAKYAGHTTRDDVKKTGRLQPGEMWNPSKLVKSSLSHESKGTAEVSYSRVGRCEVVTLKPVTGGLAGTVVMTQVAPMSEDYTVKKTIETPYSLHMHSWKNGKHYDLRIQRGLHIDEWAVEHDPRSITDSTPALRKLCSDETWMSFDGERMVSGVVTKAKLLDTGTASILSDTLTGIEMSLTSKDYSGTVRLRRVDGEWVMEAHRDD